MWRGSKPGWPSWSAGIRARSVHRRGGAPQRQEEWLKPGDADVVLAFNMITIILPLLRKLVEFRQTDADVPVPYAGHDWTHAAAYMQKGMKLELIASSDFADLDPYVSLFRTIHHLRHSKVLLVSPPAARPKAEGYTEQFGTTFGYPTYLDLKAALRRGRRRTGAQAGRRVHPGAAAGGGADPRGDRRLHAPVPGASEDAEAGESQRHRHRLPGRVRPRANCPPIPASPSPS